MDKLENLVFSGGGVRGVSFCGTIMALRSFNQEHCSSEEFSGHIPWVKRTAGASIGALFACAVALRISGERLFRLLDTEAILEGLVPTVNFQMLQQEFGLDNGKILKDGVIRVLEVGLEQWGVEPSKAESFTFTDLTNLTGIHVSFSVTRIGNIPPETPKEPQAEILSVDTSPDLAVADALVMSMTVPILYKPIHYLNGLYVDGGLLNNTPTTCMDPDTTLIIRLNDTSFDTDGGLQSYLTSILYAPVNWIDKENIKDYPYCITVGSADVKSFSFKASREMLVSGVLDGMLCTFKALTHMCLTASH